MTPSRLPISPDLTGYCDRFEYEPGGVLAVHAFGDGLATLQVVELVPPFSPVEEQPVPGMASVDCVLTRQATYPGSFAIIEANGALVQPAGLALSAWIFPTRLDAQVPQGILAVAAPDGTGLALAVVDGHVALFSTGSDCSARLLRIETTLLERQWTYVTATLAANGIRLTQAPLLPFPRGIGHGEAAGPTTGSIPTSLAQIVIGAAACRTERGGVHHGVDTFNGKIEAARLETGDALAPLLLGAWDFSSDIGSDRVRDVSGHERHGRLVNAPTRAVTGRTWTGDEPDFRRAPDQYAAVHFHDDDLADAGWDVTAQIRLPDDLPSGAYGVRLRTQTAEDIIPFFVVPRADDAKAPVAFLASTFNYLAYANAHFLERTDYEATGMTGRTVRLGDRDRQLAAHPALRGSLYDLHSDGSGRCISSSSRPIFNFRADYQSALQQAPRHLGADLFTIAWLRQRGVPHQLLTDHALDDGTVDLSRHTVLITSSHPEYWSGAMLSRLEAFIAGGGRVMYLGGNGFYWVTARDPARPHLIECRRGHSGVRAWSNDAGETHLSITGEAGGLWRNRGRAPNRIVGIGMAGQGSDLKAPGFLKTDIGRDPDRGWMFEGVDGDVFGEAGYAMGGAAGDEIDRYDPGLGSPAHADLVARSLPLGKFYKVAVEDVEMIADGLDGFADPRVRADVVLFDWAGGGAVFSTGSIAWADALGWNGFDNDVERVTWNVLHRFMDVSRPVVAG